MNGASDSESETAVNDSLWLELSMDGRAQAFELYADETRAVAVGSLPRADFRIDRPGVAPVQFHIEREGGELWIVPAYSSHELRVDTARIAGPRRIERRAMIEFCGVRMEARLLDPGPVVTRTSSARLSSDDRDQPKRSSASRVFEQHECGLPERTGSVVPNGDGALPTVAIEKLVSPSVSIPEQPTTHFAPFAGSVVIPVQRTVIIEALRVIPLTSDSEGDKALPTFKADEASVGPIETTEHTGSVNNALAQEMSQVASSWMTELQSERDGQLVQPPADTATTTYFEPFRISSAPFPVGLVTAMQSTTDSDAMCVRAGELEPQGWFEQLGQLSKQRPWLVWLAGTSTMFALAASIALLSKHHQRRAEVTVRHSAPTITTALPVAKAADRAAIRSTEPIIVIPAVPVVAAGSPKKGQARKPELVAAVNDLISGRYSDAQAAYATLAAQSPDDPSLLALAQLLAKKLRPQCSSPAPISNISCPEVKR